MVSGKPPRHSKSNAEPVTIDLDAKDVKAISADVDAAKTDDKTGETTPAAAQPNVPPKPEAAETSSPAPVWEQTHKTPMEPAPNVHKAEPATGKPQVEKPADKQPETTSPKAEAKPVTSATDANAASASAAGAKPATLLPHRRPQHPEARLLVQSHRQARHHPDRPSHPRHSNPSANRRRPPV